MVGNALLAILKLVIGIVSGSYAVIADGIDSVTDIGASLVVLLAARVISRPPNLKFPYGYRKADTIATKVLSFFIFFAGAQLAYTTVRTFLIHAPMDIPDRLAIWVTLVSMAGKLALAVMLLTLGKKVDSPMLLANGRNMRNDILISLSVLISLLFTLWQQEPLIDRIIALAISIFIMVEAIRIFMKSNIDLMDGIDDTELYSQFFDAVNAVEGAYHPHRVRARKIGSYYMVNLDIEVQPHLSVKEAHEIARNVEKSLKSRVRRIYDVMVHVEPLGNLERDEKYGITESDIMNQKQPK
jgi:cation diffusion facilitator family transporter